jgi:4-amino-4-deoxy-L-arabinose transferase-like glycosyltransferase
MPRIAPRPPFATALVALLGALKLAAHVATNATTPYGFHRDEFLYMAMGRHLELWRMEFPPAIAILAELSRGLFGDSLLAVRLVPALAGVAILVLAAVLARELGGGRFAQGLAALAVLASPLFLRAANLFQPVVLDQLWWTLALVALVRVCRAEFETRHAAGAGRWWIALGIAGGLGLLTKFSIAFLGVGVLVGVLATPLRDALGSRRPWLALLTALAIGSPSLVGQFRLAAPVVGQMRALRETQLERVTAWDFLGGQLLWARRCCSRSSASCTCYARMRCAPTGRSGGRASPPSSPCSSCTASRTTWGPIYPLLFAAGAVAIEAVTAGVGIRSVRTRGTRGTVRVVSVLAIVAYGLVVVPLGLPLLPPESMARYAAALGVRRAVTTNTGAVLPLPQDYADMLGWEEQVAAVARVYHGLPPEKRAQAVVLAANYGEAGALDFYGPRHGLPAAVSAAGTYWFFGPGDKPGDVAVTLGIDRESLDRYFASVTPAARVTNAWAVEEEADVAVHVCEQPFRTLQAVWPSLAGRN